MGYFLKKFRLCRNYVRTSNNNVLLLCYQQKLLVLCEIETFTCLRHSIKISYSSVSLVRAPLAIIQGTAIYYHIHFKFTNININPSWWYSPIFSKQFNSCIEAILLAVLQLSLHKKWSFPLRISSLNVTKSAVSSVFGHIYWRNP